MPLLRRGSRLSIPAWFDWRHATLSIVLEGELPFNPSLVRLAPGYVEYLVGRQTPFNPSLVRLAPGAGETRSPHVCVTTFNPSLVRLAQVRISRYGKPYVAFNPSLVRLAPAAQGDDGMQGLAFNPSLVRLAQACLQHVYSRQLIFQSQLGSIGAALPQVDQLEGGWLSIPAWFDWRALAPGHSQRLLTLSIPAWFDWRRSLRGLPPLRRVSFNPSLVRLAPYRYLLSRVRRPVFQSQLGSIGAHTSPAGG